MAVLEIKNRKKMVDTKLVVDLTQAGFGKISYSPLSKEVMDNYAEKQNVFKEMVSKEMAKMLNLSPLASKKKFKGNIEADFLKNFDMEEMTKIQEKIVSEYNMIEHFVHDIDGMPTSEEFSAKLSEDLPEHLVEEVHAKFLNDVYTEFVNTLSKFEDGEDTEAGQTP